MLEVLIAVLVLSIGLLGLAGLQAASLRNNYSSYLRSQATLLAYGMSDRMRANMAGVTAGNYNVASTAIPSAVSTCTGAGCTPAEMAQNDANEWKNTLKSELPGPPPPAGSTSIIGGTGVVCIDSTPDDGTRTSPACDGLGTIYAIKVWWTDDRNGSEKLFAMSFRP